MRSYQFRRLPGKFQEPFKRDKDLDKRLNTAIHDFFGSSLTAELRKHGLDKRV